MRQLLLLSATALGLAGMSIQAQAACNLRGEYCTYPSWAANAFSHPRDRVPDWVLDDAARFSAYEQPPRKYRSKRRYRRDY